MKVIYDASAFAVAQHHPLQRAGSNRVVEEIAHRLCRQNDCQIRFYPGTAFRDASAAFQYARDHRFAEAPVLFTRLRGIRTVLDDWRYDPDVVGASAFGDALRQGASKLFLPQRVLRRLALAGEFLFQHTLDFKDWRAIADADIFHSQFAPIPAEVRQFIKPRTLVTILDVIPLIKPKFFVPGTIQLVRSILDSAQASDWYIAISHATKNALCEYGGIDPSRVFVTHLAASAELFYPCRDSQNLERIRRKYGIPDGPYLLTLNKLEPRKNIVSVIHAFACLVDQQHLSDLSLVLAGRRGWLDDEIFKTAAQYPNLKNRIVFTGYVDDSDLAPLYSGALAFAYPSFYEGFGLPPLEAMQCGVPVITSNVSSLPEVVGDAGILIDPMDVDALSQAVFRIYSDSNYRQSLSGRGFAQARQFSWDRCVAETLSVYRTLLAN